MTSPLPTSGKTLAVVAGLALVTATVVLWGSTFQSGKLVRQNAELTYRLSLVASEPQWSEELTRQTLERSLRAARPELPADAKVSFAAPCWAIVQQEGASMILKWSPVAEGFAWSLLDRVDSGR